MRKVFILGVILAWSLIFSASVFANGGDIRIAEGKYLVNISSSPVTPVAGQKVAMLISFGDVVTNELLVQDLHVWIEIRLKVTEEVIFPQQEFRAERGVLEFPFIYLKPGLHELFVRFEKPDEPGKIYESEDFLVDVQESRIREKNGVSYGLILVPIAFGLGMLAGFLRRRR